MKASIFALLSRFVLVPGYLNSHGSTFEAGRQNLSKYLIYESTGFCPPLPRNSTMLYLNSPELTQHIHSIGSIGGFKFMRTHWLLSLKIPSEVDLLVNYLKLLKLNGMNPIFEVMGNMGGTVVDFDDFSTVKNWKTGLTIVLREMIKQFGAEALKNHWIFETWNEPDHVMSFEDVAMTDSGYDNYVETTLEVFSVFNALN